jgi:Ca2+-binding EF-hand superfamily protein
MADDLFTPEDRENFKTAFDAFDENRDDRVATDLLGRLLRAIGFNPLPSEVEDMVEDIGEANIDFESFMYILYRHARAVDPERELIAAFRVFDKTGEGLLPVNLIREILENVRQPFTPEQINELFKEAGIDGETDSVDYEDFVTRLLEF